jgi:hypothetical protein
MAQSLATPTPKDPTRTPTSSSYMLNLTINTIKMPTHCQCSPSLCGSDTSSSDPLMSSNSFIMLLLTPGIGASAEKSPDTTTSTTRSMSSPPNWTSLVLTSMQHVIDKAAAKLASKWPKYQTKLCNCKTPNPLPPALPGRTSIVDMNIHSSGWMMSPALSNNNLLASCKSATRPIDGGRVIDEGVAPLTTG